MARIRALVTLQRDGGLPEDQIVNTWHFEDDSEGALGTSVEEHYAGLHSRLATYYTTLQDYFSQSLTGQGSVKIYRMEDPKVRPIRSQSSFTIAPGGSSLPGEVALCVSMKAAPQPGIAAARLRGRIYLGPLSFGVLAAHVQGASDVRPADSVLTTVLQATEIMALGSDGAFRLAVYSPTIAGVNENSAAAFNDVTDLWMDNAFDTQRRRGAKATKRYVGALGGPTNDFVLAA